MKERLLEKLDYLLLNIDATQKEIGEEGITAIDEDTIDCWKDRVLNIKKFVIQEF